MPVSSRERFLRRNAGMCRAAGSISRWTGRSRDALAFVERIATAETESWFHVSQFILAEVEGEPAAALCAMPAAGTVSAGRSAIAEVAEHIGLNASETAAIFRRGAYAAGCWIQGGEADWLIEHVATLPKYRGRGLVQGLIDHALLAGRSAGFQRASISFLIGNEAAQQCYAKAGFTYAEEKRDVDFEAITNASGFRRFARRI